jgi:putative phage-type endonuclease
MLINQDFSVDRTQFIGGSDIGAILGLSRYRTPLQVWLEKTGKERNQVNSLPLRFGSFAESFVASEYSQSTGTTLLHDESTHIHPKHPYMSAHIDRFVLGNGKDQPPTKILECKTANPFSKGEWGEPGTDQVPMSYLAQCIWYMAITDINRADLAVLFGNSDFRIYEMTRDQELEVAILQKAATFWNEHVLKDIAPPPTTLEDCQTLFRHSDPNQTIEASNETIEIIQRLQTLNQEISFREEESSAMKQQIMIHMGVAESLSYQGQLLATWRAPKPTLKFDLKRFESEHPDLTHQYKSPIQNSRRLVIKDHSIQKPSLLKEPR